MSGSITTTAALAGNAAVKFRAISDQLAELMAIGVDAELSPDERAAVNLAIQAYVNSEIRSGDSICSYIHQCAVTSEALKTEIERLASWKRNWDSRISKLKECCLAVMRANGITLIESQFGAILRRGNGGQRRLKITDYEAIPKEYWCNQPTLNEAQLKADLERGEKIPGAYLEPRGEHIEIR